MNFQYNQYGSDFARSLAESTEREKRRQHGIKVNMLAAKGMSEALIIKNSVYKLFVINNDQGDPIAYKLSEHIIDPARDYSNTDRIFEIVTDGETNAFKDVVKEFDQAQELYEAKLKTINSIV